MYLFLAASQSGSHPNKRQKEEDQRLCFQCATAKYNSCRVQFSKRSALLKRLALHVYVNFHRRVFLTQAEEDDDDDVPRVENVVARQLLGSRHHLFSADDTNVVGGLQVFRSRVWVSDQKEKQAKKISLELYV